MRKDTQATLDAALAAHDRRTDRVKAARDKVELDRATFIHEFRLRAHETIRPAMVAIGDQLQGHGHTYAIDERTVLSSDDGKLHLTGITMTCNVGSKHAIAFEAADGSNGVAVSSTVSGDGEQWHQRALLSLDALSSEVVEQQIAEVLTEALRDR